MVLFDRSKGRSWKAVTRTNSHLSYSESDILSVMHVLGYNIATFGSVLQYSFEAEKQGEFFSLIKKYIKKTLTRGLGVTRAETGNYCISFFGHRD